MKNQTKTIGKGYKFDTNIFGVSINGWSASKFINKNGEVAIALSKNDKIADDERVYHFASEAAYQVWKEEIHNKNGHYLHYQDGGLLCRAFPNLLPKSDEYDDEDA